MRHAFIITAILASIVSYGCRSNSSSAPDSPSGDSNGGVYKIQDVQNDAMPPGTPVALKSVVVTAIDTFGGRTGDIWVEEPEGGPFSGVHVYKADPSVVSTLQIGDIVDISGAVKSEFALTGSNADPTGRTVTELEPAASGSNVMVAKTGSGSAPAPAAVDALMIGMMADADMQGPNFSAAWEQWEGVLITLTNVSAASAPKAFGSATPTPADSYDFGITGVVKVEGSLADITMSGIARNTCLSSATGVLDYFYDYLLLPRQSSELATGGTGCPAPEATAQMCGDGIDNDANGFADCGDDGCMVGVSTCRTTMSINALDTASTLPTGGVELGATETACVTAVASNGSNMWIAKGPGAAAAGEGVYVYGSNVALPAGIAPGVKVDVIGKPSQFKPSGAMSPLLEVDQLQITKQNGACAVTPVAMTATALSGNAMWVGSLVTLTNVKVMMAADAAHHNVATLSQGTATFEGEGDIHILTSATNTCFSSITGIWTWDPYTNKYAIQPLAEGTVGAGC